MFYFYPSHLSRAAGFLSNSKRPELSLAPTFTLLSLVLLFGGSPVSTPEAQAYVELDAPLVYPVHPKTREMAGGDFNGDGIQDLITLNEGSVSVLLGSCDGAFLSRSDTKVTGNLITVADLDSDGRPDAAVANAGTGAVTILMSQPDGVMVRRDSYPTESADLRSITTGDFNGDGKPDLVVVGYRSHTGAILLGLGDGTFTLKGLAQVGPYPTAVATGDFNRDARIDMVVTNYEGKASICLGKGDGTFEAPVTFPVGGNPETILVTDWGGDGRLDMITGSRTNSSVTLSQGRGDGSFLESQPLQHTSGYSRQILRADLDGDGLRDFIIRSNAGIALWAGKEDGSHERTAQFLNLPGTTSAVLYDFNSDHRLDIAVAEGPSLKVYLNRSAWPPLPSPPPSLFNASPKTGPSPVGIVAADFNRDGRIDLATPNVGYWPVDGNTVSILLGIGGGAFQPKIDYTVGLKPVALATGDFNGDGNPDLVTANPGRTTAIRGNTVSVLLGRGDGTFLPRVDYTVGDHPNAVGVGDFNNDRKADIVTANTAYGFSILLGKGDGSFETSVNRATDVSLNSVTLGDFNNDNDLDLAMTNLFGFGTVYYYLGLGNGSFSQANALRTGSSIGSALKSVSSGDLNGDGNEDLLAVYTNSAGYIMFPGKGDGTFLPMSVHVTPVIPQSALVKDMNTDGHPDLVLAGDEISILYGQGDGTLQPPIIYPGGGAAIIAADLDGDSNLDLASPFAAASTINLVLNRGDGTFLNRHYVMGGLNPRSLVLEDFNRDNKADLVFLSTKGAIFNGTYYISFMAGNGDGTFLPQADLAVDSIPLSIVAADFNGDSLPDLAVSNSYNSNANPPDASITIYLCNGDGTFNRKGNFISPPGLTGPIVTGDLNGDGQLDLAVTNGFHPGHGDGTFGPKIFFYPEKMGGSPYFIRDFTGDGKADVALRDGLLPGNGDGTFKDLIEYTGGTEHNPTVLLPNGIGDFNGDGRLDLVANGPAALIGNGDGTFRKSRDYRFAPSGTQIGFVAAEDFNLDGGRTDLAVLHAGEDNTILQMMHGYGEGTFHLANRYSFPKYSESFGSSSGTMGDLNNDGRPDLVLSFTGNHIAVLLNETPSTDSTPPNLKATLTGTMGSRGWYTDNVTVSLAGSDSGSGFDAIYYSLDSASCNWNSPESCSVYTAPISIDEGCHTLYYFGQDKSGNRGITHAISLKVNKSAPIAQDVASSLHEGASLEITLPAQDGGSGDPLSYTVVSGPEHGILVSPDGIQGQTLGSRIVYVPSRDYNGPDSFTYKVNDGNHDSLVKTVHLTVHPVNDAPLAVVQPSVTVVEDTPMTLTLKGSDVDGDVLSFVISMAPAHGKLGIVNGDQVVYTPAPNYNGPDTFTFKARDGVTESMPGLFSLSVTPVEDPPLAYDEALTTDEDQSIPVTLKGADPEGAPITFSVVTPPIHGTLTGTPPHLTYTPSADYNGTDSLTFTANDGELTSAAGTIRLTIHPGNDAPQASDGETLLDEDTPTDITLTATDIDKNLLEYSIVKGPEHGTLGALIGGRVTYTPAKDYSGPDNFTFKASDGDLESNVSAVSLTITPVNDAPISEGQSVIYQEETPVEVRLSASDAEGDAVTYKIVERPENGSLSGIAPELTYTPRPGYTGPDRFTYKANDGSLDGNTAAVELASVPPLLRISDGLLPMDGSASLTLSTGQPTEIISGFDLTLETVTADDHPDLLPIFSLGDQAVGWQLAIDPEDPWHVILMAPAPGSLSMSASLLRLNVRLASSDGIAAGGQYRLSARQALVHLPDGGTSDVTGQVRAGIVTVVNGCGEVKEGDATGDGTVDVRDAVRLLQVSVGIHNSPDACALGRMDVDCDGRVTVGDAVRVLRHIAHGEAFPSCTATALHDEASF